MFSTEARYGLSEHAAKICEQITEICAKSEHEEKELSMPLKNTIVLSFFGGYWLAPL